MIIRRIVLSLLLVATLGVASVGPAHAGRVGGARVASEAAMPKAIRKLLDYARCIGAIVIAKDPTTASAAVAVCGHAAQTWWEE